MIAVVRIHLCTMVGILDVLSMLYALSAHFSTMAYCVWENYWKSLKRHSRTSLSCLFCSLHGYRLTHTTRERREHRIFKLLLQMIPGLEERLITGSDEDVFQ